MDEQLNPNEYRTGDTHPKNTRTGPIAALFICAIFLGGLVSAFSLLNMYSDKHDAPISFTREDSPNTATEQTAEAPRPPLGFTCQPMAMTYQFVHHLPFGLFIDHVEPESLAAAMGITPGDVLVSFDGTPVTSIEALNQLLANCSPHHRAKVVVHGKDGSSTFIIMLN